MIKDYILDNVTLSVAETNLAEEVARSRPEPLRQYDQIYMKVGMMHLQMKIMENMIADQTIVFLGEGIMSLMFGMFHREGLIKNAPKHMTVLDFDERVLVSIDRFARDHGFANLIETCLYNALDPVPSRFFGRADWFYTNPPYGSKNNGLSPIIFIDRCTELTKQHSRGCIILPYDSQQRWAQEAMLNIQLYLTEKGYVISDMVQQLHTYYLPDNPVLASATVLVDRIQKVQSRYGDQRIPLEKISTLYGSVRDLPHFIKRDGREDFCWD